MIWPCLFGACLTVAFVLDYPHNVVALAIFIVFALLELFPREP